MGSANNSRRADPLQESRLRDRLVLLAMERHRIIDLCPDAFGLEVGAELVSVRHTDHKLIVDVAAVMGARIPL